MNDVSTRPARASDAAFLAWVMQEADRMGGETSSTDLTFDIGDERRLAFLARLSCSSRDSYYHYRRFLVAEVAGVPVAALSGYVPDELPDNSFELAVTLEAASERWPAELLERVLSGKKYASSNFFKVTIPDDALRVEWVATSPDYRRQGLTARLLARLLGEARARGQGRAFVGTKTGNEPALRAYLGAGFEVFAECRHIEFEALYGAPGLTFLRRDL